MTLALQTIGLKKAFGSLEIIRGVDLKISQGERHALIGPNGAGKSTMFGLLSGGIPISSGEVRLFDRVVSGEKPATISRLGLARSFQVSRIFPRLSVFENIRVAVFARWMPWSGMFRPAGTPRDANDRAHNLLDMVRLRQRRDVPAGALSYSEQRALELALTMAMDPKIIMLDEPTAGMSKEETDSTIDLIMNVSAGRTLVIVEHDMEVVFKVCDRISVLVYGQLVASDTPANVRANPAVQEAYLGQLHAAH